MKNQRKFHQALPKLKPSKEVPISFTDWNEILSLYSTNANEDSYNSVNICKNHNAPNIGVIGLYNIANNQLDQNSEEQIPYIGGNSHSDTTEE